MTIKPRIYAWSFLASLALAVVLTVGVGAQYTPPSGGGGGGAPSGPAGGVLGGTYPNPHFATGVGTAGSVLLEEHTASSSTSIAFTTCFAAAGYDTFSVTFSNLVPSVNGAGMYLQVSTNGGSSYDSGGNYGWSAFRNDPGATATAGANSGDTKIDLSGSDASSNTTAAGGLSGEMLWTNANPGVVWPHMIAHTGFNNSTVAHEVNVTERGSYQTTTPVNAFQIIPASGNIVTGIVRCYGMAK